MLITLSGMVGSGKSTAAKQVMQILGDAGVDCHYVRFRGLRLLPVPRRRVVSTPYPRSASAPRTRAAGYRPRRLSALVAGGYLARMLAFRLVAPRAAANRCWVLDRFFYDNLVHYRLDTRREKVYLAVLKWMMPVPDLSFVLVASPATIAARRPEYALEYVVGAERGYQQLRGTFPELIAICTDSAQPSTDALQAAVHRWLVQRRPPSVLSTRSERTGV